MTAAKACSHVILQYDCQTVVLHTLAPPTPRSRETRLTSRYRLLMLVACVIVRARLMFSGRLGHRGGFGAGRC